MYEFDIDCPNEGLGRVMRALKEHGIKTESRNGPVIRFPEPVSLQYHDPQRRILDNPIRDANPFFHLFETMWMLAGHDKVAPLEIYNSGMKQYSDDGIIFAAPYGYRWRKKWGDQIQQVVERLKANPEDRRILIQIWDPRELFKAGGKDFACNQQVLFDTRPTTLNPSGYFLDMTVTNRSNDLVYGAMGSNLFHFSLLHEYIAYHTGLSLGTYYQISKNMHLYLENPTSKHCWEHMDEIWDGPKSPEADVSLSEYGLTLDMGPIKRFVDHHELAPRLDVNDLPDYLEAVVKPVCEAYRIYKYKSIHGMEIPLELRIEFALAVLGNCQSPPLVTACEAWFQRRLENRQTKEKSK
jgi:thymidylate synthase-like protein